MKKLRQDYKKIKDKHNLTGRGRTSWKFFEPLNEILGTRPATQPPLVLETLDPTSSVAEENEERTDEEEVEESGSTVINEDSSESELNEAEENGCHSRSTTPETSAGI